MEKLNLNMSFDPTDQEAAFVYSILTSMGKGNKRIHCMATMFKMLSAQYGGKITPANLDLISSLIERNGLVPSGYIAVPLGSISSSAPVQAVPDYTQTVAIKSKKAKGKKTSKEATKETVNTKSVSVEPVQTAEAPAEKISPAPVQAVQSVTPAAEAVTPGQAESDDGRVGITDEEFSKKSLEVAKQYILDHFIKSDDQRKAVILEWETTESIDGFDSIYEELVTNCSYLDDPGNKLPDGYTDMEVYADEQVKKQGYYVSKEEI